MFGNEEFYKLRTVFIYGKRWRFLKRMVLGKSGWKEWLQEWPVSTGGSEERNVHDG